MWDNDDFLVDLSVVYNVKSQLDCQLPIAPTELRATDDCLTKSLISIGASLGKVNSNLITKTEQESVRGDQSSNH